MTYFMQYYLSGSGNTEINMIKSFQATYKNLWLLIILIRNVIIF